MNPSIACIVPNEAVDVAVAAADAANLQIALEAKEKLEEQTTRGEILDVEDKEAPNRLEFTDEALKNRERDDEDGNTILTYEDSISSSHMRFNDTTNKLSVDRDTVLEELKKHNDMVLGEHKRQLEAEFQSQVQNFLSNLKNRIPLPQQQARDVDAMYANTRPSMLSRGRTPITPQLIEERNDRILTAARSSKTAPRYQIFENDNKPNETTAILRATIEEPSPPTHVRMSVTKGAIDKEVESTVMAQTKEEAYFAKLEGIAKSMPHLSIYNESYDGKGRTPVEVTMRRKKKKKGDSIEVTSSSQNQNDKNREEIDDVELLGKVDNITRHMMLKSKFLFEDSKKFIKKASKKQRKSREKNSTCNVASLPNIYAGSADECTDEYENDCFDDGGLLPSVWTDENTEKTGSYFIKQSLKLSRLISRCNVVIQSNLHIHVLMPLMYRLKQFTSRP